MCETARTRYNSWQQMSWCVEIVRVDRHLKSVSSDCTLSFVSANRLIVVVITGLYCCWNTNVSVGVPHYIVRIWFSSTLRGCFPTFAHFMSVSVLSLLIQPDPYGYISFSIRFSIACISTEKLHLYRWESSWFTFIDGRV